MWQRKDHTDQATQFLKLHPEVQEWANVVAEKPEVHGRNTFVRDVLNKLWKYGSLSDKQLAAVQRSLAQDAVRFAEREQAGPAPTGDQTISGIVLSVKPAKDVDALKGVLKTTNGSKVWCTVPDDTEVGEQLSITATWTRAKDDPKFAFGTHAVVGPLEGGE